MIDAEERTTLALSRAMELTELLRRRIIAGALQPGQRLDPSRQLAPELGVSRVTLSTAMKTLRDEGYLVIKSGPSGGVFIGDLQGPATQWAAAMREDRAKLDDILDHRLAVETRAAALAALRRDQSDLVRLQCAVALPKGVNWRARYRGANWIFHEAVAAASKSLRLRTASRWARGEMWSPSSWLDCEDQAIHVMPAHTAIFQAIRDQDSTKAAVAMMADIEATRVVLRGLVEHQALLGEELHLALCEAEKRPEILEVFASHMRRKLIFRFAEE